MALWPHPRGLQALSSRHKAPAPWALRKGPSGSVLGSDFVKEVQETFPWSWAELKPQQCPVLRPQKMLGPVTQGCPVVTGAPSGLRAERGGTSAASGRVSEAEETAVTLRTEPPKWLS